MSNACTMLRWLKMLWKTTLRLARKTPHPLLPCCHPPRQCQKRGGACRCAPPHCAGLQSLQVPCLQHSEPYNVIAKYIGVVAMQENCAWRPPEDLLPLAGIADTLVDAGLLDVAIVTLDTEAQRDCDRLVVATGHSRQHALAG